MLTVDGSQGEGGGQIVRSSLALSMVTGQPIAVNHIRARRRKPGLQRQHVTAVRAALEVCRGEATGAEVGSLQLTFRPHAVRAGDYHFDVGSAGSTTLVLQTVLPALLMTTGASTIKLQGGTHNPLAPPFDFLAQSYLPLLRRMGVRIETSRCRPGFYPAGGGEFSIRVESAGQLQSLELLRRGAILNRRGRVLISKLPLHIADRECHVLAGETGWDESCFSREIVTDARGPGNVVLIEVECECITEVFASFGARGKPAETVASEAVAELQTYLSGDVPVGFHLADQLLLPLGLAAHAGAASAFRTLPLTPHATTHIDLLRQFLNIAIQTTETDAGVLVQLSPASVSGG